MPTLFITGAGSGLGQEFVRQYAAEGWKVIATCRRPETFSALRALSGDVLVRQMDITQPAQIAAVAAEFAGAPIDLLLNNAAIHGPRDASSTLGALDVSIWLEVIRVNAVAPLKVAEAFLPNVRASALKQIAFVSSRAGSIAERGTRPHHRPGGSYIYRSSKATLNSAAKNLAYDLQSESITVICLHPGWVRTEMGGSEADLDVPGSVSAMRRVLQQCSPSDSGTFRNFDGSIIPW